METPEEEFQNGLFFSGNGFQRSKSSSKIKLYKRPTRKGNNFKGFTDNDCEISFSNHLQSKFQVEMLGKDEKQLERQIFMIDGLSCSDCSLTFSSSSHLERHQRFCRNSLSFYLESLVSNKEVLQEPSCGMLICPKCPILCPSIRTLKMHLSKCREINLKPTESVIAVEPAHLENLAKSNETNLNVVRSQVDGYSCVECPFKVENLKSLLLHVQSHYLSDLICTNCNSHFGSIKMLSGHLKICSSGERRMQCSDCGDSFSSASSLESHLQSCPKTQCLKCAQHIIRKSFQDHILVHLPEEWTPRELDKTVNPVCHRLCDGPIEKDANKKSNDSSSSVLKPTGNTNQDEGNHHKQLKPVRIKKLRKRRKQYWHKKKIRHSRHKMGSKSVTTESSKMLDSNCATLHSKKARCSASSEISTWCVGAMEIKTIEHSENSETFTTRMSSDVDGPLIPADESSDINCFSTLVTEHFEIENGFSESEIGYESETFHEKHFLPIIDADTQDLAHTENFGESEHLVPQAVSDPEDGNELTLTIVNVEGGANLFNWDDENDSNGGITDDVKEDHPTLIPEECQKIRTDAIVHQLDKHQVLVGSCSPSYSNEDGDSGIDATEDSSNQDRTEDFESCINSTIPCKVTQQNQLGSICAEDTSSRVIIPSESNILNDTTQHTNPLSMSKDDSSSSDMISKGTDICDDKLPTDKSLPDCNEDPLLNNVIISSESNVSSVLYLSSSICENEIVVESIVPLKDAKPKRKYSILKEHNYALPEGQTVPWFKRRSMTRMAKAKLKSVITAEIAPQAATKTSSQPSKNQTKTSKRKEVKATAKKQAANNTSLQGQKLSSNSETPQKAFEDTSSSFTFSSELEKQLEVNAASISARDQFNHCKQEKLNLLLGIVPNATACRVPSLSSQSSKDAGESSILNINKIAAVLPLKSLELKTSQGILRSNEQSTDSSFAISMKDASTQGGSIVDSSEDCSKSMLIQTTSALPAIAQLSRPCLKERPQKAPIDPWKKFVKREQSMLARGYKQIATVLPRKENISKMLSLQINTSTNDSFMLDQNYGIGNQNSIDKASSSESSSSRPSDVSNTFMFIVTSDGCLIPHPNCTSSQPSSSEHSKENLPPIFIEGSAEMSDVVTHNVNLAEALVSEGIKEFTQPNSPRVLCGEQAMPPDCKQEKNHVRVEEKILSSPLHTNNFLMKSVPVQPVQSEPYLNKQRNDSKPALLKALQSSVPNLSQYNIVLMSDGESENNDADEGNLYPSPTAIYLGTSQEKDSLCRTLEQNKSSEVKINLSTDEDEDCSKSHVVSSPTEKIMNETNFTSSEPKRSCDKSTMKENASDLNPNPLGLSEMTGSNLSNLAEDLDQTGPLCCVDTPPIKQPLTLNTMPTEDHSPDQNPNPLKPFEVIGMDLFCDSSSEQVQIRENLTESVQKSLSCSEENSLNELVDSPRSKSQLTRTNENFPHHSSVQNLSPCPERSKIEFQEKDIFQEKVNVLAVMEDCKEDATQPSPTTLDEENELLSSFIAASEEEVMEAVQLAVSQLFQTQTSEETTMGCELISNFVIKDPTSDSNGCGIPPCQTSDHEVHKSASECLQIESGACEKTGTAICGDLTLNPEKLEVENKQRSFLQVKKKWSVMWSPALYPSRKLMSEMKNFRRIKHGRQGKRNAVSPDRFNCTNCSQWFYSSFDLQNHVCLYKILSEKIYSETFEELLEARADSTVQKVESNKNNLHMLERKSLFETFLQTKTSVRKRWFDCDKCEMRYKSFSALLDHKALVHTEKALLQCHVCGKEFSKLQKLAVHFAKSHKIKIKCSPELDIVPSVSDCEQETTTAGNSRKEAPTIEATGLSTPVMDVNMIAGPSKCGEIEKILAQVENPKTMPGENNMCQLCQKTFNGKSGLVSHINQAHATVYKCPVCFRRFTYLHRMKTHFMQHLAPQAMTEELPSKLTVLGNTNVSPLLPKTDDDKTKSITTENREECETLNPDKDKQGVNEDALNQEIDSNGEVLEGNSEKHKDLNPLDISNGIPGIETDEISPPGRKISSPNVKDVERCSSNSSESTIMDVESTVSGDNLINVEDDEYIIKKRKKTKWKIIHSSSSDENCSPEKEPKSSRLSSECTPPDEANFRSRPLVLSLSKVKRPQLKCDVCNESFKKKPLLVQHRLDVHNVPYTCASCHVIISDLQVLDLHLDQCENAVQKKEQTCMVKQHDPTLSFNVPSIREDIIQPIRHEIPSSNPFECEKLEFQPVFRQNAENLPESKTCIASASSSETSQVQVEKKFPSVNVESPHAIIALEAMPLNAQSALEAQHDFGESSSDAQFSETKSDGKDSLLEPNVVLSSQPTFSKIACISAETPEDNNSCVKEHDYPAFSDVIRKDKVYKSKKGSWKCEVCSSEFSSKGYLERHMIKSHGAPSKFPCTLCEKFFTDVRSLRFHRKSKHSMEEHSHSDGTEMNVEASKTPEVKTSLVNDGVKSDCAEALMPEEPKKINLIQKENPFKCTEKVDEDLTSSKALSLLALNDGLKNGCVVLKKSQDSNHQSPSLPVNNLTGEDRMILSTVNSSQDHDSSTKCSLVSPSTILHQANQSDKEDSNGPNSDKFKILDEIQVRNPLNSLGSPQKGEPLDKNIAVLSSFKTNLLSIPADDSRLSKRSRKGKIRKCEKCDKIFRRDIDLTRHNRRLHKKPAVVCEVCQLHIGNYKLLEIHQSKIHTVSTQWCLPSDLDQSFNAGEEVNFQVGPTGTDPVVSKDHREEGCESSGESALLQCSDCPLTYKTFSCLKRHRILVHSEPANHYCDTCGKGFSYPHSLKNHAMIHSRGKWKSKRADKISDLDDSDDETSFQPPLKKQCIRALESFNDFVENVTKSSDSPVSHVKDQNDVSSCGALENAAEKMDCLSTIAISDQLGATSTIHLASHAEKPLMENNFGLQSSELNELPKQEISNNLLPLEGSDMTHVNVPFNSNLMAQSTVNVIQNSIISNTYNNFPNPNIFPYFVEHPTTTNYSNSALSNPGPGACLSYQVGSIISVESDSIPIEYINAQPMQYNPGSPFSNYSPFTSTSSIYFENNPWAPPFQDFKTFNACALCGLCLPNWYALQEHYCIAHPQPRLCVNGPLPQQYQASDCPEIVPSEWSNLPLAQLASTNSPGFSSGEGTSFQELKSHSVVHCSVCGVCFPSLLSLQEHYKTHMAYS